jgi:hypothetical protein
VIAVLESVRRRALKIAGVILVRTAKSAELDGLENARLIRERGGVTVFPSVPFVEGDEAARIVAVEAHFAEQAIAEALLRALDGP